MRAPATDGVTPTASAEVKLVKLPPKPPAEVDEETGSIPTETQQLRENGGAPSSAEKKRPIEKLKRDLSNVKREVVRNVQTGVKTLKETATPEGAKRVALSCFEQFKVDLAVSAHASHDMLVLWLCPADFKALELEDQHKHCLVLWNPLYWISYLPLVACVVSGKWLHGLWGQGEAMRPDETIEESRVRMHWIYCLDGPICGATVLDLIDLLLDLPFYTQKKFTGGTLSFFMTVIVTAAYVLANSYFLDVMRRRSLVGLRLVVVYQTVFAVGLLNMLVAGAVRNKQTQRNGEFLFPTWLAFISWSTRLVMTLFMLGAAFVYSRLWNAYRSEKQYPTDISFHNHGAYLQKECIQYSTLPIAAILIWVLLVLAATLDEDIFWDALV